jgi:hypothetical protein
LDEAPLLTRPRPSRRRDAAFPMGRAFGEQRKHLAYPLDPSKLARIHPEGWHRSGLEQTAFTSLQMDGGGLAVLGKDGGDGVLLRPAEARAPHLLTGCDQPLAGGTDVRCSVHAKR